MIEVWIHPQASQAREWLGPDCEVKDLTAPLPVSDSVTALLAVVVLEERYRGRKNSPGSAWLDQLEAISRSRPVRTLVLWQGSGFNAYEAERVWMDWSTVFHYDSLDSLTQHHVEAALECLRLCIPDDSEQFHAIGSALKMPDDYDRNKFVSLFIGGTQEVLRQVRHTYHMHRRACPVPKVHPLKSKAAQKWFDEAVKEGQLPRDLQPKEGSLGLMPHALILGETGTGKTLLARWLHQMRSQHEASFQDLNCGALPDNLIEVELFGGVKGAYTGLDRNTPGKIFCSAFGTLFLDEIGELPLDLQAKLLKFLDDGGYYPMGWHGPKLAVPTAVVAASNRNLEEMVAQDKFREDLFHRFRLQLRLPPLRERLSHFHQLVDFVLQNPRVVPQEEGQPRLQGISEPALQRLRQHTWPGNFRELEQVLWRAAFEALEDHSQVIQIRHLKIFESKSSTTP